jgi:hypothetical protein
MPKPPLGRGLDPLIRAGLIETPFSREDRFYDFLIFCEMPYRENLALKNELRKCKVDPEECLRRRAFPLGSPGQHRTVFDGWYVQIAADLQARIAERARTKPSLTTTTQGMERRGFVRGSSLALLSRARNCQLCIKVKSA